MDWGVFVLGLALGAMVTAILLLWRDEKKEKANPLADSLLGIIAGSADNIEESLGEDASTILPESVHDKLDGLKDQLTEILDAIQAKDGE